MIWFKAWIETRSRLLWAALMLMSAAACYWTLAAKGAAPVRRDEAALIFPPHVAAGAADSASAMTWAVYLQIALMAAPFAALLLAGSGVNSQTNYGVRQGAHPSMLFTLSLPVARWKWLAVRNVVGIAGFSIILLLLLAVPWLASPWAGGRSSLLPVLGVFPFAWLGCMVFYSLSMALGSYFDELGQGVLAMACVGFTIGAAAAGVGWLNIFAYMSGQDFLNGGMFPWAGTAVCVGAAVGLTGLSVLILERKEF